MAKQNFIVHHNGFLEVFDLETEKKQLVDRVKALVGVNSSPRDKEKFGRILEDRHMSVFTSGISMPSCNFGSNGQIHVYLGTYGAPDTK